jgi:hypothetical protein
MGSSSSVPISIQPDNLPDDQLLKSLEDNIKCLGALTPPHNKFFRSLHCALQGEEFDYVAKVCFVKDVDLAYYYQRYVFWFFQSFVKPRPHGIVSLCMI